MLFNSLEFACFFPLVTLIYFAVPHPWRCSLLLAASCYFYAAFVPAYLLILGFTIVVDYFAGIFIETATGRRRTLYLVASLAANIGVLMVFKYYHFLNENLSALLGYGHASLLPELSMVLPIGLSFHTFQAMSYTIEVYRGGQQAERHFGVYALYVMFYPQLVAGPIERPQNLLHQFRQPHSFDWPRIGLGLKWMAWGLFKKVVIADRLAPLVERVYNDPGGHDALSLLVATVAFAFQIYADFSGYSDMAVGAAQVLGFRLMRNFDRPYFAPSLAEFWRRWHISLSTWFRDYVFIPLGGSRAGRLSVCRNLLLTFLLSGVWHGARWTFVLWGLLNGMLLVFELVTKNLRERIAQTVGLTRIPRLRQTLKTITTFSLITLTWVFFRARTVDDAVNIVGRIATESPRCVVRLCHKPSYRGELRRTVWSHDMRVAVVAVALLLAVEYSERRRPFFASLARRPVWTRLAFYYALAASILFLGVMQASQRFIYFQF
jgi:alginate O-acetyltransferase complex protein AlgI